MTTFREFQASKVHGDVSLTYGQGVSGFTYAHNYEHCQIADSNDSLGRHWLVISNLERVSDDLDALERLLWADTRMQTDILSGEDIEHFARGYFDAIRRPYDHDLCTIALAGKVALSVREIQAALDPVFKSPLYRERNP